MRADSDRADEFGIQQLRAFCLVVEKQSYSAAAREMKLAVPTVWEQVRVVEARYATQLFEKRGRRIVPSDSAKTLCELLRPILTSLDSTFRIISERQEPQSVTLVCGMRMMSEDLNHPLERFHRRYPDVSLRLLHGDLQSAKRHVASDVADLALTLEPTPGDLESTIACEQAYENEYLAIFPESHPIAKKSRLRLADFVQYPLVLGHSGTSARQAVENALHRERLGQHLKLVAETDNSAFTVSCIRAGLGIGIIAGCMNGPLTDGLVSRSLRKELGQAHVVFLWKRGRNLSAPVVALMELIREINQAKRSSKNKSR